MRILTGLRTVTKLAGPVEVRFSSVRSPFLRQVSRRALSFVPMGRMESWCARVWIHMGRVCRTWHIQKASDVVRTRKPFCGNCPGGLLVGNVPVVSGGRVVGLVESAVPRHPAEGGSFRRSLRMVRHLPLSRETLKSVYAQIPPMQEARVLRILEVCRDIAEAVLATYRINAMAGRKDREAGARSQTPKTETPPSTPDPLPHAAGLAEQARNLIRLHHTERGLTRQRLAGLLGCAPISISHRFRKDTGESLPAFRNRLRVESAREMLANTAFTVAEIAERAGFGTHRQFNRAFRKLTGQTPKSYRRENIKVTLPDGTAASPAGAASKTGG